MQAQAICGNVWNTSTVHIVHTSQYEISNKKNPNTQYRIRRGKTARYVENIKQIVAATIVKISDKSNRRH